MTEVADTNDAGFRHWGRPKETEQWAKVNTERLKYVGEIESLALWLKSDVWAHSKTGVRKRIEEIRKELNALERTL